MPVDWVVVGLDNGGTTNNGTILDSGGRFLLDRMAEVPSHASTGVRNQKSANAAITNKVNDRTLIPDLAATTAPVARGTRSIPHAPCSRGTTIALSLGLSIVLASVAMSRYYLRSLMAAMTLVSVGNPRGKR